MASVAEANLRRCLNNRQPYIVLPVNSGDLKDYHDVGKRAGINLKSLTQQKGKKRILPHNAVRTIVQGLDQKKPGR